MQKILFPFRIADDNNAAFCYAASFARKHGAKLTLMSPYTLPNLDDNISSKKLGELTRQKWLEALKEIHNIKGFYLANFASTKGHFNLNIDYKITLGNFHQEVLSTLKNQVFDLVVLNWPQLIYPDGKDRGSQIKQLLETSSTPTLLVPENIDPRGIHHIAFVTDLMVHKNDPALLQQTIALAQLLDATVEFIHVSTDGTLLNIEENETLQAIKKLVKTGERYQLTVLKSTDPVHAIRQHSIENEVGLLIAVKKQRNFLSNLFHHSLTGQLVNAVPFPVLILKETNATNNQVPWQLLAPWDLSKLPKGINLNTIMRNK